MNCRQPATATVALHIKWYIATSQRRFPFIDVDKLLTRFLANALALLTCSFVVLSEIPKMYLIKDLPWCLYQGPLKSGVNQKAGKSLDNQEMNNNISIMSRERKRYRLSFSGKGTGERNVLHVLLWLHYIILKLTCHKNHFFTNQKLQGEMCFDQIRTPCKTDLELLEKLDLVQNCLVKLCWLLPS